MSDLQTILGLIGKVQSHEELRRVSEATRARWNALQHGVAQQVVQDKGLIPGVTKVSFQGRGVTIYGTVKSINPKSVSVTPQGGGPHWKVSPQLLTKVDKFPEEKKSTPDDLMREILDCYGGLSPENLSCDGEASRAHIQQRSRELNGRLAVAFQKLGRRVSETDAYEWERKNPNPDPLVRRPFIHIPPVP